MRNTFKERTVIITGASSGIGKALALQLADEGAWLALAARNAQRLDSLAEECEQRGGKALAIPTDVADESRCRALVQRTQEIYGRIDTLVNNAGIDVVAKLEDLPDLTLFKHVIAVNFYGTVYCTYYALPYLKETRGRIVNMSSLGGMLAIPLNTSYVASKFAVIGFSDSLRMEVKQAGVSVTAICPSLVVTEFHERYLDKDGHSKGPAGRAIYTEQTMTADQCAQIVVRAARRRKRQVVMQPGPPALWLKLIAPGWVDRLTISRFLRPAVKRMLGDSYDSAIDKNKS
jgi:short-subunit dehydrogenase